MNDNELRYLERSRKMLRRTLVGTKIVSMEKKDWGNAKLTLSDGSVVYLEGDGECCAVGEIKTVSELLSTDHVITNVQTSKDGETWFIYAGKMTVGAIGVDACEGTGYYGFGITIKVRTAGTIKTILDANEHIGW